MLKIWLDDAREPPDTTWEWASSFTQLRFLMSKHSIAPDVMSFDHDLGLDMSTLTDHMDGYEVIKWISNQRPGWYPKRVLVHSANPVGAENIRKWDEFWRHHHDAPR